MNNMVTCPDCNDDIRRGKRHCELCRGNGEVSVEVLLEEAAEAEANGRPLSPRQLGTYDPASEMADQF